MKLGWSVARAASLAAINFTAGFCFVAIKAGLAYASPLAFGGLRALLAGCVLLGVGLAARRPVLPERRELRSLLLLGLIATTLTYGAMFASPALMGAGIATVLGNVQPLFVVIVAAAVLREPITAGKAAALMAGVAGVVLIVAPGSNVGMEPPAGVALALIASAAAASASVLMKRLGFTTGVVATTGWQLVLGSLPLVAAAWLAGDLAAVRWSPVFIALLLFLAVVGTALPTTLWYWLLRSADDAGWLSLFLFLTPVIGLAAGIVWFDEMVSLRQLTGIAVVFVGLLFAASTRIRSPCGS